MTCNVLEWSERYMTPIWRLLSYLEVKSLCAILLTISLACSVLKIEYVVCQRDHCDVGLEVEELPPGS